MTALREKQVYFTVERRIFVEKREKEGKIDKICFYNHLYHNELSFSKMENSDLKTLKICQKRDFGRNFGRFSIF